MSIRALVGWLAVIVVVLYLVGSFTSHLKQQMEQRVEQLSSAT